MDFIKFLNHFQPISKSSQQASVYKSFKLNLKPKILNEKKTKIPLHFKIKKQM